MLAFKFFRLLMLGFLLAGCQVSQAANAPQPDKTFTLQTTMVDGKMAFVGVGGDIEAQVNPELVSAAGDVVRVVILNADGLPHDFSIADLSVQTAMVTGQGRATETVFTTAKSGTSAYFCTVAGHRQAGMEGKFTVSAQPISFD